MAVSQEEVRYIADLARLRLSAEEESAMADQMSKILDYMAKLNELGTEDVPPMSHVLDLRDVFRSDEVSRRISREDAVKEAPDTDGQYFRVPKVIE